MGLHDWSLIIFTILGQMSVGVFLILGVIHTVAVRRHAVEEVERLTDRALLAIGPVLVLGFIASLGHLGSPVNAYLSILNVADSWLSREILFGALFAVSGAAFALMQWRKVGPFALRRGVALIAAALGIAFVVSMALVYMLPLQPSWNLWATPVTFLVTSLLTGALAIGVAFVASYAYERKRDGEDHAALAALLYDSLRGLVIASVVLVGAQLVTIPLQVAVLSGGETAAAVDSAARLTSDYGIVFALRLALAFIGAAIFGLFVYRSTLKSASQRLVGGLVGGAFGLVLVGEVLGRYLFYAANVPIGV